MSLPNNKITKSEIFDLFTEKSDEEENITFIFGAGASYGYSYDQNIDYVPPIVANLFDEDNKAVFNVINRPEHQFVLGQKAYLEETLESFDNDLEKYLSFLYNKNDDDPTFSALLLYIQDLCWLAAKNIDTNSNNYKDLVNRMSTLRGKSSWTCISFNYDTILEKSIVAAGRDDSRHFNDFEDYTNKNPKVIKIHGSVNFRFLFEENISEQKKNEREIFGLMMREKKIDSSHTDVRGISSDVGEFYIRDSLWNQEKQKSVPFHAYNYPLMMIPIHNTQRSAHPFFQDALEEARREIDASSLVVVVGYNFGDELLLEQLDSIDLSNKKVVLVGTKSLYTDPDTHPCFQNAVNNLKGADIKVFEGNGFYEFVRSIIRKQV